MVPVQAVLWQEQRLCPSRAADPAQQAPLCPGPWRQLFPPSLSNWSPAFIARRSDTASLPSNRSHSPDTYPHTSCSDDRHVLYFTQLSTGATVNGRDIAGSLDIAPLKFSTGLPIRKEAFPSITPTPIPMSLASASPQQQIDGQKPGKLPMMCWTALQWGRLFYDKMDC